MRTPLWLKVWTNLWTLLGALTVLTVLMIHYVALEDWGHIALPAAVLLVEFYMLGRMTLEAHERAHESQERDKTLDELATFRLALGRTNYLEQIESAIRRTEREIVFTSATMACSSSSSEQKRIFDAVLERQQRDERAGKNDEDMYKHRGIVAKKSSALAGALELALHTNVQVRMSTALTQTRLRFVIRDHSQSILGVAVTAKGDREAPSALSFSVDSGMLAESLCTTFNTIWKSPESLTPWEYFDEQIISIKQTKENFSKQEARDMIDWERIRGKLSDEELKKSSAYMALRDFPDSPDPKPSANEPGVVAP